jgi:hypothetical protein
MRTIHQYRQGLIESLRAAFALPTMFAPVDQCAEILLMELLSSLCWIDERDSDWAQARAQFLWGQRYVLGQFETQQLGASDYLCEVTSTYANVAHWLGYFEPSRVLQEVKLEQLKQDLDETFFSRTWTNSEIRERFGEPSHEVRSPKTKVVCFASQNKREPWIFFDMTRPEHAESFMNPVLRDVRIERNRFQLLPWAQS